MLEASSLVALLHRVIMPETQLVKKIKYQLRLSPSRCIWKHGAREWLWHCPEKYYCVTYTTPEIVLVYETCLVCMYIIVFVTPSSVSQAPQIMLGTLPYHGCVLLHPQ